MMMEEEEKHTEERLSIIGSFIIHVLIFVLFILVTVQVQTEIPEFSVVDLMDIASLDEEEPSPVVEEPKTQPVQPQPEKELVELPKRNFQDLERSEVPIQKREKLDVQEEKIEAADKIAPPNEIERERTNRIDDLLNQEKRETDLKNLGIGERIADPSTELKPEAPFRSMERFSIEWMAGTRIKISGELPRYPEGINKEVTIKVRFFVKPDGTVGDMMPDTKGERELEDICMRMLKQWRFSKLGSLAPQVEQEGVITFRFQLR